MLLADGYVDRVKRAVLFIARRSLDIRRTESLRPWLAASLRAVLVACVVLALAEPRLRQANETSTVLFVLDRSLRNGRIEGADRVVDTYWKLLEKRSAWMPT